MRNLLYISIICWAFFTSNISFSQGYVPFPENYAIWTLHYAYGPDNSLDRYYIFTADGDTIINATSYNKLYRKETTITAILAMDTALGFPNYFITLGAVTLPRTYWLAYRNDVPGRTVYKIDHDSTTEKIWYNFNFQIGDTLPRHMAYPDNGQDTIIVGAIDTITYCGLQRRRYTVSPTPCYWGASFNIIEGIGNDQDFTTPNCSMGEYYGTFLDCFVEYDHCGPANQYSSCNVSVGVEENMNQMIGLHPNPASTQIFAGSEYDQLIVYDIMGKYCFQRNDAQTVDISNLSNGLYFIIAQKKGKKYYARFVKQD